MADREKVVRDIRYLKSFGRVSGNPQITEIAESAIALLNEQQERIDRLLEESASNAEMAEGLRELLKEQDAVEPYQHDAVWLCGNCGKEVVGWDDDIDGKENRYPFCRQCGRQVKWE